ncbi:hypothetical protein CASFOL_024014 [Castilleja foliolosa]|uniref:AIPP2-like SPOC-like domain-containing protein n=1 Tax=Castilleja foliolosa TaxID=1961234 RepID=A0ABD3CQN1_9LAMI
MTEICLQCGDIGHKKKLIYCYRCTQSARHRYCMDVLPKSKHQKIRWLCEECDQSNCSKKPISENKSKGIIINNNNNSNFTYSYAGINEEKSGGGVHVEPLIRTVWSGMFNMICNDVSTEMRGVHAFLSSRACKKVIEAVALFQPVLRFEIVPRLHVWPKSFVKGMGPTDDNIGVYFFSFLAKQDDYDRLVFAMISDDLAMRACLGDAELLVFASTELPKGFWRFQGNLYLWGVFRGKQQGI